MKVAVDTNILLRDLLADHPQQARIAAEILDKAELVAVTLPVLCELAWVLRQGYKKSCADVALSIRVLISSDNVVTDIPAVQAGLAVLDAGGDFADGVISHEGTWLGAEEFVSFDKQAVKILKAHGKEARLLS
jgi:predicted nucleic-acid-binding protein